jgi:hypothetical protein
LPACCSQPAVAGGIIYANLWGELALTWSHRLCLFRVLLCGRLCNRLSPFQAVGKVTLPPRCQARVFIYSSCGRWVFPPLLWSFPPSATLTSFPTPGCWVWAPLPPEALQPARLVYLQSREGFPSPNLQRSGRPTLFPACLNCSYCLLLSFSFFPLGEVSLSRGLCCSGPGLSVGVPWYREAHLIRVFPSHMGAGHWWPRGPSSFLRLM